jgi:hypothetical protein
VPSGVDRDLELGADSVGRGDQDGIAEPGGPEVEGAAEPADRAVGTGPRGRARQRLDRLDERAAGIDIDASVLVAAAGYGVLGQLGL